MEVSVKGELCKNFIPEDRLKGVVLRYEETDFYTESYLKYGH
jgi:hypothetical protein